MTGRFNARGRGAKVASSLWRQTGWRFDGEAGTRLRARRVMVNARVVKLRGAQSRAASAPVFVTCSAKASPRRRARKVGQDRLIRLGRAILIEANEQGLVDLRSGRERCYLSGSNRYVLIERLKKLERLGPPTRERAAARPSTAREKTLREMGERGDIIKTMHRGPTVQRIAREAADYVIHRDRLEQSPIVGRVVD